jgi:polar amino acid transport system permease protein
LRPLKHGLDRPHSPYYYLFYKAVFVCVLLGAIGLLAFATSSLEYTWRWQRVPQYFWATGHTEVRSDADATVESIIERSGSVVVRLEVTDNPPEDITLPTGAELRVSAGETLYQGDVIANVPFSKPGILLEGLWVTIKVSALAIALGIVIGLGTGLWRLSDNPALRWGAITYIEIIRGSPLLVQIFLWYFVAGYLIDGILQHMGMAPLPPLWYGVIALAIFTGAYVAEIVRAGIQSVHRGQMEAARALGMTHRQAMRKVILPQAFRRIMPPLAGQFISLIKDSSLLGVMAVRELTKATREAVTSSLQSLELWFTCALLYLALTFTLSLFVQYLERRAVRR